MPAATAATAWALLGARAGSWAWQLALRWASLSLWAVGGRRLRAGWWQAEGSSPAPVQQQGWAAERGWARPAYLMPSARPQRRPLMGWSAPGDVRRFEAPPGRRRRPSRSGQDWPPPRRGRSMCVPMAIRPSRAWRPGSLHASPFRSPRHSRRCDRAPTVTLSDSRATTRAHHLYGRRNNCGRTVPKFGTCVDLCGGVCYAPVLSPSRGCSQRGSHCDDAYPAPPLSSCPHHRCGNRVLIRRPYRRRGTPTYPHEDTRVHLPRGDSVSGLGLARQWTHRWGDDGDNHWLELRLRVGR